MMDVGGRHDRCGARPSPWEPSGLSPGAIRGSYHGGRVKVRFGFATMWHGRWVLEKVLRDGNLLLEWALNRPERVDPQVPPRGPSARGRPGESAWRRHLEVGRFPALCGAVALMKAWLASDLSELDLLVPDRRMSATMLGGGDRRRWQRRQACPTENTVVVQALLDNLLARGLDPTCPGCSSSMARRRSAKRSATPSVWPPPSSAGGPKGRNIIERLPLHLHASVKKALRQAWDQDDADKAERLLRNLARRLELRNRASRALEGPSSCRTNSGARLPAPTSSRTRSARCVRSPATSNAGGTPRWRSDGPPPGWRPRRPSVASRPIVSCPYSETLSRST